MTQRYFTAIGFKGAKSPTTDDTFMLVPDKPSSAKKKDDADLNATVTPVSERAEILPRKDLPGFAREWDELAPKEKRACKTLGWTEDLWQASDDAPLAVSYGSLNGRQKAAAGLMLGRIIHATP